MDDLLAMFIVTLAPAAVFTAIGLGLVFYVLWGWLGGLFGLVAGYGTPALATAGSGQLADGHREGAATARGRRHRSSTRLAGDRPVMLALCCE